MIRAAAISSVSLSFRLKAEATRLQFLPVRLTAGAGR
jgi:hypothetical protein